MDFIAILFPKWHQLFLPVEDGDAASFQKAATSPTRHESMKDEHTTGSEMHARETRNRASLSSVRCIVDSAAGGWLHCRERHCRLPSLIEQQSRASPLGIRLASDRPPHFHSLGDLVVGVSDRGPIFFLFRELFLPLASLPSFLSQLNGLTGRQRHPISNAVGIDASRGDYGGEPPSKSRRRKPDPARQ